MSELDVSKSVFYDCIKREKIEQQAEQQAKQKLEKIKNYCNTCNLKTDFTACDVLQIIEEKENE